MFNKLFLCGAVCAALAAQPRLPKRGEHTQAGSSLAAAQQRKVDKLKTDLEAAAPSDKDLSSREISQLTNDFYKALNSAGISVSEFNAAAGDAQPLFKASGVTSADATLVVADLKAIGAEVQKTAHGAQPAETRKEFGRK